MFNANGDMFEPVHSALSLNIATAIVFLTIVCSTMGALIEEKKSFAGQERGNIKLAASPENVVHQSLAFITCLHNTCGAAFAALLRDGLHSNCWSHVEHFRNDNEIILSPKYTFVLYCRQWVVNRAAFIARHYHSPFFVCTDQTFPMQTKQTFSVDEKEWRCADGKFCATLQCPI